MAGQKKESMIERVGALYKLLDRQFPEFRSKQGHLDVPGLARAMGFAHETLYRCVRKNDIKVYVALEILKFSHKTHPENPLYWQDLAPFVLPEFDEYSDPSESMLA